MLHGVDAGLRIASAHYVLHLFSVMNQTLLFSSVQFLIKQIKFRNKIVYEVVIYKIKD
jgi:hypothetical protein